MTETDSTARIVAASREIHAPAAEIFELIADPSRQPEWDGNDNLASSSSPRVRGVGDVFEMTLTKDGARRENHVVEFEEGKRIAWLPSPVGEQPRGHLWRWELEAIDDGLTRVTHTYDWTNLTDETSFAKALSTTEASLDASIANLQQLAETGPAGGSDA
ncbi:putative protein [Pseudoclavibacter triregionum]|nr:putative protein [Pseudoclavibacter triregionum]